MAAGNSKQAETRVNTEVVEDVNRIPLLGIDTWQEIGDMATHAAATDGKTAVVFQRLNNIWTLKFSHNKSKTLHCEQ